MPGDTLVMSRPPSPISPAPSFIFNQNANNNNNVDNVSFRGTGEKANHVPQPADHSGLNYTFGSLEDEAGTHRPDPGELQQEVLELEHTNRRLTGENAELTTHLTYAEDLNTSLREQCRQLEQALGSVQHQLAGARRMETEIEEFRNLLDMEREEKGRLLGRLGHLEKDNQELAARLEGLVDQVNAAHEEAEGRATREAQLVAEHKTQVATLMEKLLNWKSQAQSQGALVRDLEDTVKDLKRVIEVLKDEKTNLEQQLTCLREELTSVTTQADHEISGEVEEDVKETRSNSNIMGSLKKMPWGPPLYSTPFSGRSLAKSSQETPQSIHSEIHTMGENNGSLPFCEKSEDALRSFSHNQGDNGNLQCSANECAADSSTALLSSMLKWWRLWEEQGVTLLLGVQGRDASALHDHFAAHHDELLKIESKLQGIIKKKTQTQTPPSSGRSSLSGIVGRSRSSSREHSSTRSSLSRPRTPGSHVSQLISKFETASPSASPVPSELSERLSRLVDYNSNVSKDVDGTGQCSPASSVDSNSRRSPVIFKNIRECKIQRKQKSFEAELCLEEINISEEVSEEETDDIPKDVYAKARSCDSASAADKQNVTQENVPVDIGEQVVESDGVLLKIGLDAEGETVKELSRDENEKDEVIDVQFEGIQSEGVFRKGITVEVDLESDIYMENSHLMRLMTEVKEQKLLIEDLRCQLCVAEEEKETHSTYLSRLHRLLLSVTSETYRWTEGVRKEWLSRVPGVSEEGAADPLRSAEPLDDGPLTGTHSREEIESLIRARCDLGCPPSKDDLAKEYVNPENLAAELERELLALKLHVARSHALLHHYQSSSLYGSRSEVSTPPAPPLRQTQGVEAGVECDLCGPTCVPRPSGSTATQTPASPTPASLSPTTPATPECEESEPTSTLWEADEDVADSEHASFTPQHRPLYQKIVVPEEEEEEEEVVAGVGEEDMAVSSDHALYAPKPTYDQLDQYRPPSKRSGDEKLRRTGLATISPQKGGSSDSDDERELPIPRSPQTRLRQLTKRSHSDPEVIPLSPPPSLYTEEEEEEVLRPRKEHVVEQEPVLPSTPESGSSNSSANPFRSISEKASLGSKDDAGTGTSVAAEDEVDSQQEEGQCTGGVFPSLPDNYLRSIGLARDDHSPTENLSAQEIEGKFKQLSLAFNTDRLTLRQRLDVQQRQRDTAENNFETEINLLRSAVLALHADCLDSELVDNVTQVRRQLDVLITTSTRLVSASEVWGAVQQEWRVSRALEVLLLHVENVKRLYERDHQELEEMRKLLAEYQIDMPNSSGNASNSNTQSNSDNPTPGVRLRTFSLAVGGKQQSQETRRISFTTGTTHAALSAFLGTKSSKRRASLMPDIRPFQESKASIAAVAAAAAAAAASSRASISAASKDKAEKNGQTSNGVFSITEEGSESGGEGSDTPPNSSGGTPTALAISRTLAQLHPDLYSAVPNTQEATRRLSEDDSSGSITQSMAADSTVTSTPAPNPEAGPQHWLMVGLEDVIGWIRGGRWPYSSQQTVLGARYAFTSLLLLLAAFFLLLTISSSDQQVPQPYHPGWTSITHVLHPFVTLRYVGTPPT